MTLRRDPLAKTPIAEITHTNLPLLNRFVSHDNPYARMHTHTQSPPDWPRIHIALRTGHAYTEPSGLAFPPELSLLHPM